MEKIMEEKEINASKIHVPIVKYITFSSSEEFGQWQLEKDRRISAIQPIITHANANQIKDGLPNDLDMKINISVFVTYWE